MNIIVGCLALVCEYGSTPHWFEVVDIDGDVITCDNGHRELFTVNRNDIRKVTDDDSVLM